MKGIQRYVRWQGLLLLLFAAVAGCSRDDEEKGADENEGGATPVVVAPETDEGEAGAGSDSAGGEQKTADADAGAGGGNEAANREPAVDGWLGADDGEGGGSSAANGGPKAAEKRVALRGQTRAVKDIQVTAVKLPGESLLPSMQWSPDGKYVFILSEDGVLRKVAYPSLEQEVVLETGGTGGWMQLSKLGLLVGIPSLGQIWLVDGKTLAVKKQIAASNPGMAGFASSLQSTAVYVSDDDSRKLIMIDLKTGNPVKEFTANALQEKYGEKIKKHPDSVALTDLAVPAMTPDGKYIFCEGFECLHRLKVSGEDLIYEEMGPRLGSVDRIFVDQDSLYVAMGGYIYQLSDLGRPVVKLDGGIICLDLDRVSKNIYAGNWDYQLMVFTSKGLKRQGYILTGESDDVRQILAHPAGGKLLVLTESELVHVELSSSALRPEEEAKPVEKRVALSGEGRKVEDLSVTEVKLPGESPLGCMQWSPDGEHVYILSEEGVLRKVAYPSLEQEVVLETGGAGGWLQWSKLGLLVGLEGIGQIWLVDGRTLAVKKEIAASNSGMFGFTSSLQSTAVYVSDDDSQKLIMIDLETGNPLKEFSADALREQYENKIKTHADSSSLTDLALPTMTPDGKYILCEGFECLHRLKVSGEDLIYEEAGPRIGSNVQRIFVDPDSRYVAMPSGGGNERPAGHPEAGSYVTYVYQVSDLGRPVITLAGGAYPGCIALDKVSKNVYLDNAKFQLMIFTAKGVKGQGYVLTDDSDEVRQLLAHPTGGKLLVLTESALLNVVLGQVRNDP